VKVVDPDDADFDRPRGTATRHRRGTGAEKSGQGKGQDKTNALMHRESDLIVTGATG